MSFNCRTFKSKPPNSNKNIIFRWKMSRPWQIIITYLFLPYNASWHIGLAEYLPLNILQYAQPPLQQIAHQQQTHIAQELPWDKRGGNVKERKEENVSKRKAMYRAMQYTLPNYSNIINRFSFPCLCFYFCILICNITYCISQWWDTNFSFIYKK